MLLRVKSLQSCPTLSNPMDYSPPGASVHGISQARILKQVAISAFNPDPRVELLSLMSPVMAGRFLTTSTTWKKKHRVTQ